MFVTKKQLEQKIESLQFQITLHRDILYALLDANNLTWKRQEPIVIKPKEEKNDTSK